MEYVETVTSRFFKPSRLANPTPIVNALESAGLKTRLPMVVWPYVLIECAPGPALANRSANLKHVAAKALERWKSAGISWHQDGGDSLLVFIPQTVVPQKKGRPRRDDVRAAVLQLRSEGKSWEQIKQRMNRKTGEDLTVNAYRNLVQRKP